MKLSFLKILFSLIQRSLVASVEAAIIYSSCSNIYNDNTNIRIFSLFPKLASFASPSPRGEFVENSFLEKTTFSPLIKLYRHKLRHRCLCSQCWQSLLEKSNQHSDDSSLEQAHQLLLSLALSF